VGVVVGVEAAGETAVGLADLGQVGVGGQLEAAVGGGELGRAHAHGQAPERVEQHQQPQRPQRRPGAAGEQLGHAARLGEVAHKGLLIGVQRRGMRGGGGGEALLPEALAQRLVRHGLRLDMLADAGVRPQRVHREAAAEPRPLDEVRLAELPQHVAQLRLGRHRRVRPRIDGVDLAAKQPHPAHAFAGRHLQDPGALVHGALMQGARDLHGTSRPVLRGLCGHEKAECSKERRYSCAAAR
jgi:hypothetical protein